MPVKKSTGKSAAKPLAKKVAAKKRPATKKTSAAKKGEESLAQRIANAIAAGEFDGDLQLLDDALTERANANLAVAKKTTPSPAKEKKVAAAPKKTKELSLVGGSTYAVSDKFKPLAGAKIKFLRPRANTDGKKSVVEMMSDKPGNPKGKQVVIPTAAIVEFKGRAKK